MTTRNGKNSRSPKTLDALWAAFTWVGAYEISYINADDEYATVNLTEAFAEHGTPAKVKRAYPDEIDNNMIDAYALLRRMVTARERAARRD